MEGSPAARSLVLDLLSTLRGGFMPVSALVAAGGLFDLRENSVRVAVARLLASGQVERDERGRYRLGAGAEPIDRRVRSWSRPDERMRDWDGSWVAVHTAALPRGRRRAQRQRARAQRLLGFQALRPGLQLRPDNLRGGVAGLRDELHALGLEAGALVFRMDALDAAEDARARGLWDVVALCQGYARSLRDLEASERQLPRLDEGQAMVESFLVGGRVIRQLVLDPLLPDAIVPGADRRALVEALRRYDQLGRQCWAAFLDRHGARGARTPVDSRMPDGAGRLGIH